MRDVLVEASTARSAGAPVSEPGVAMSPRLGLDLGGTSIKWVLLGAGDVILDQGSVPTPNTGVEATLTVIADLAAKHAEPAIGGAGVGLAVPGSVDHATSRVLELPNIAGDWNGLLVGDHLSAKTGLAWRVVNDARAFAMGELATGVAKGTSDALFVTLGTGVGGALAVHGVIEMGAAGLIGEIGHVSIETGGRPCGCGHLGCLETYAGAAGMLTEAARRGFQAPGSETDGDPVNPLAALFSAAHDGDPIALAVVSEAGAALGTALGQLSTFLAPTLVVIGGGVSRGFARMEPSFRVALADHTRVVPGPEVRLTERPDFAGAIGAALWATEVTASRARHSWEKS